MVPENRQAQFKKNNEEGREAEGRVREILCKAGAFCNANNGGSRQDWEMLFMNHAHRVECKNEDRYENSPNICVETYQGLPPKPSGINTSEATVCVHTLGKTCALYRRRDMLLYLRKEIAAGRLRQGPFPNADNHNGGFIINRGKLLHSLWFDYRPIETIGESRVWTY